MGLDMIRYETYSSTTIVYFVWLPVIFANPWGDGVASLYKAHKPKYLGSSALEWIPLDKSRSREAGASRQHKCRNWSTLSDHSVLTFLNSLQSFKVSIEPLFASNKFPIGHPWCCEQWLLKDCLGVTLQYYYSEAGVFVIAYKSLI